MGYKLLMTWKKYEDEDEQDLGLADHLPHDQIPPTQLHRVPNRNLGQQYGINNKLDVFQQRCLCETLKIRYTDHITNEEVLRWSGAVKLHNIIARRRLRLAGHVLRMDCSRIPRIAMHWQPRGAKRPQQRPRNTWRRTII
uniref:Uncharacterized protein n=1 Tax=Romanomermis culicivorax TaxID=13658 RepID=A0A915I7N6_ROMCU